MSTITDRARELASLSTVASQPHVFEAMRLLVEMADRLDRYEEAFEEVQCQAAGASRCIDDAILAATRSKP